MKILSNRNHPIDFIRGIAIISVLVLHYHLTYSLSNSALNHIFNLDFLATVFSNGNYGVTMFFVISGYLITITSLARFKTLDNISLKSFYTFRFSRILPCLFLALSLIAIFSQAHIPIFENDPHSTTMAAAIFSVLTFSHNALMEKIGYFNYCLNIYWSLSVEEMFYLGFPLLCLFFKRQLYIIIFLGFFIVLGPLNRSLYSHNEIVALYGYFSCFDAIAIGCLTALLAKKITLPKLVNQLLSYFAWGIIVSMFIYCNIMNNVIWGISIVAVATAILLIVAHQYEPCPLVLHPTNYTAVVVRWFGKHSYELYLFHIIILAIMKQNIPPAMLGNITKLMCLVVFMTLSAAIAGLIATCYSEPMNKSLRALTGLTLLKTGT